MFGADFDEADGGSAAGAVFVEEGGGAEEDFFSFGGGEEGFDELFAGEDAAGGFGGVGEEGVCEGGDFAADIVGEDAGLGGGFGRESPDAESVIEENGGDVGAGDEVVEVLVGLGDVCNFGLVLVVEGLEFLVDGFELFVGALEFFIRGLELLVRGLEFFVGGLEFLDGGLEADFAAAEFFFEVGDAEHAFLEVEGRMFDGEVFFHVFKKYQKVNAVLAGGAEGFDEDIDGSLAGFDRAEFKGPSFVQDLTCGGGEAGGEVAREETGELEARAAFGDGGILGGGSEAVEDIQLIVEHEAGAAEAGEDSVCEGFGEARLIGERVALDGGQVHGMIDHCSENTELQRLGQRGGDGVFFPKEVVVRIQRLEVVLEVAEALAEPERKDAFGAEGVVQDGEHTLLGGRLEVNENIPATDEVDAGEGGILEEVVLGKDDTLPDGAADLVMVAVAGEVFLEVVGRDISGDGLGINPLPGDLGGAAVEVGGEETAGQVDLAAFA